VIDDAVNRRLIGVVTDRDLCLRVLTQMHDPTLTTVEDCMTPEPFTCAPDTDVRQVLALMAKQQVRRIPVVDRHKRVVGIIGLSDLLRHEAINPRDTHLAFARITKTKEAARAQAA
jgi:CBS domain-containing protein